MRPYLWRDVYPGCCTDSLVPEIQNNERLIVADVGSKASPRHSLLRANWKRQTVTEVNAEPSPPFFFIRISALVLIETISHIKLNGFF